MLLPQRNLPILVFQLLGIEQIERLSQDIIKVEVDRTWVLANRASLG